jgi:hypothetical protein
MVNLPFVSLGDSRLRRCDSPELEVLQLSVSSEAPTPLNSDRKEKLWQDEWLISAILLEINQLDGMGEAERKATGSGQIPVFLREVARDIYSRPKAGARCRKV